MSEALLAVVKVLEHVAGGLRHPHALSIGVNVVEWEEVAEHVWWVLEDADTLVTRAKLDELVANAIAGVADDR